MKIANRRNLQFSFFNLQFSMAQTLSLQRAFVFISLCLSQKRLHRANLLTQLRLDPPVRDQPHQRYEDVKPVGDPLMNKG